MPDKKQLLNDGFVPLSKGFTPKGGVVEGGYVPATGQLGTVLPKGGSAVVPPTPKKD